MINDFVFPSDQSRADSDELNSVCEALQEAIEIIDKGERVAFTALCIWEHHIEEKGNTCLEDYQENHGACETRTLVTQTIAPMLDFAWSELTKAIDVHYAFDWEFIPSIMEMIQERKFDVSTITQSEINDLATEYIAKMSLSTPTEHA